MDFLTGGGNIITGELYNIGASLARTWSWLLGPSQDASSCFIMGIEILAVYRVDAWRHQDQPAAANFAAAAELLA